MGDDGSGLDRGKSGAIGTIAARANPRRAAGTIARGLSLASWLTVVILLVTIVSLVVASAVSLGSATAIAEDLVEERVRTLGALKASEVEAFFATMTAQTRALASSEMTADAAVRFTEAYSQLEGADPGRAATEEVAAYYRETFVPGLEATTGVSVPWRDLVPAGNAAVYLQREYVVTEDPDPDVARLLDDAGDGSAWSDVHRDLHPEFLDITARLGMDDLLIVEPRMGTIVYSVAKAPDFATSLNGGPFSASAAATLVRAVRESPTPESVMVADLAPYGPALAEPVGFLASPILGDDQRLLGVLVVRLPLDEINAIMTSNGEWESEGFGGSGETFLVGADGRMRSISRSFVEDAADYFEHVEAAGSLSEWEAAAVRGLGTTVVFQEAADIGVLERVAAGDRSVFETMNYLGRESFSSYEPLNLSGLEWFVAVETEKAEVEEPIVDFRKSVLLWVSLFVLAITFSTVAWARGAMAPIRAISERLRRATTGESAPQPSRPTGGPMEMRELTADIDQMLAMSDRRQTELEEAAAERLDTLRGLLPPVIVERLDAGERLIVEQILQASVVVVVLEGLGELIRSRGADASRSILDRTVGVLDSLCGEHGLERVKVIGEAYYAGCGLNQPYLDHAPRTLAFAVDARRRLQVGDGERDPSLIPAIGIDSGPVSVGLAGSSRLVYDVWGESLTEAYTLAHRARPGEILISDRTRDMLPPDVAVRRREDGEECWQVPEGPAGEGSAP